MPMVEEDALGGGTPVRIFLAATVAEARRVETCLDQLGANYFVRVEPVGRTLFGSVRQGAAFFIDAGQAGAGEDALIRAGLGAGVVRTQP